MSKYDHWPFPNQREFDRFMCQLKGESRVLKESAIRAWIIARQKLEAK